LLFSLAASPYPKKERGIPFRHSVGGPFVSIIRVGLSETKKFAEGYEAIFGKKKAAKPRARAAAKPTASKKKKKAKKK
jgi:hypothetical protein